MLATGIRFIGYRWLSTGLYLGLGWLVTGGVLYTIGAFVYAAKRPNISARFGFHELFHVLVLAGSLSHFWLMYRYLMFL
ncbi:MAG: hemolysin III family protein [Bacillota bacterium]|nr:hemolysin III family protein [Bacillota bacterium]